jgi:aminoglycoside 3-N-acetyltransferase
MLKHQLKQVLPKGLYIYAKQIALKLIRKRIKLLPVLTEDEFVNILTDHLNIQSNDVVFIHSALGHLNLGFSATKVLPILKQIVGDKGTLLFPTYPQLTSYEFLRNGHVFDIRNSSSYTGYLTELARLDKQAFRSFHPAKSVCAIGYHASELTNSHDQSVYPYDNCSPYFKIVPYDGKIVGLGVSTERLSFVHCIDDYLKDNYPISVYHDIIFDAKCIDQNGNMKIVRTYAHDLKKIKHHVPKYMKKYIPDEICRDMKVHKRHFFFASSKELFSKMLELAKKKITIYS